MSRMTGRAMWTVAVLAIIVVMAQVAEAQREGRGRGGRGGRGFGGFGGMGFGVSPVQLASESEEVQAALKVTDEQKTKLEEINDELREARRDLFQGGGGGREEREKLDTEAAAKLAEVLDEGQQKRLMGIQIQVNGANSLFDAAVAKELKISDDQNDELAEVRDSNREAAGEVFRELRDAEPEERGTKLQELRTEGDKKLLAVLTSDQQSQFEALKGEPVEVDMSQFRGGFGGGRGFGGGGGRGGRDGGGRGDRNRDRDRGNEDRGA